MKYLLLLSLSSFIACGGPSKGARETVEMLENKQAILAYHELRHELVISDVIIPAPSEYSLPHEYDIFEPSIKYGYASNGKIFVFISSWENEIRDLDCGTPIFTSDTMNTTSFSAIFANIIFDPGNPSPYDELLPDEIKDKVYFFTLRPNPIPKDR